LCQSDERYFPSTSAATLGPTLGNHGNLAGDGRTGGEHGPALLAAALLRDASLRLGGVLDAAPEVNVHAPRAALPRRRRTATTRGAALNLPTPGHTRGSPRLTGCALARGAAVADGHLEGASKVAEGHLGSPADVELAGGASRGLPLDDRDGNLLAHTLGALGGTTLLALGGRELRLLGLGGCGLLRRGGHPALLGENRAAFGGGLGGLSLDLGLFGGGLLRSLLGSLLRSLLRLRGRK